MRILLPALCLLSWTAAAQTPRVGLSINGSATVTLYRGWPAVVSSSFYSDDGTAVSLGAQQGAWTDTLRLTISANGAAAAWPLRLLEPDSPRVVLDAAGSAQTVWLLAAEDSAQLAPGQYRLQAMLDTRLIAGAGDWKGTAVSAWVDAEVKDPPDPAGDDLNAARALMQSSYLELSGDSDGALTAIQALLDQQPDNQAALTRKADLLVSAGRYEEAIPVYSAAIEQFRIAMLSAQHPPRALLRARASAQWRAAGLE